MRSGRGAGRLGLTLLAVLAVLGVSSAVYAATTAVKPDFSLAVSSSSQSIQQGQSTSTTVSVSSVGGLTGSVGLSASGLPSGATSAFAPASVPLSSTSQTSTLTVTTAKTTPAGTYSVSVNGVAGTLKHTVVVTLTVNYALNGSFAIAAAPSAGTVTPGGTAASALTITRTTPFAGAIALSTYGALPTGVAATFSPNPNLATSTATTGSTSTTSTLQLTTTTSTPTGNWAIYVVGTYTDSAGGKYYQYAQTTLTVSTGGKPFSIATAAGAALRTLSPGTSTPVDLTLTNPNPQALTVTNLTVLVGSTSAGAACDPNNFALTQVSRYPINLPANGSLTLSSLGAGVAPVLTMQDLPRNQDGCRNVTINLAYSGTAQGN